MTTMTSVTPRSDYVPADFADLFDHYYPYVVRLVRGFGIDADNAEDVSMTILIKFLEKDALSDYRPDFVSEHGGVPRKAKFTTFLSGFVFSYVRHHRSRQGIHARREGTSIYAQANTERSGDTNYWIDTLGHAVEEDYDDLLLADLIRQVNAHLATLTPSKRAKVDMGALFARVVEMVEQTGKISAPDLAREFGVSQNALRSWLTRLRTEISTVLDA